MFNQELARIFNEMGAYLEMEANKFRSLAYAKAAATLESLNEDINLIYQKGGIKALENLTGIGKTLAFQIEEYLKTGKIKDYEGLKKRIPINLSELIAIEGVGPKVVKKLYESLKIKGLTDLEKAAKAGKISKLSGFGEKSEAKILKGIEFLKQTGNRFTLGEILPIARDLKSKLKNLKAVKEVEFCGSLRRKKETIGDLDILIVSDESIKVIDFFSQLPSVAYIYSKGETKLQVRLKNSLDVDLRIIPTKSFGAGLQYFTGSKEHNIKIREMAIKHGYKLNEYGLYKGRKIIAGETEKEIYQKLNLKYIPPELRENNGEIEASKDNKLPQLIDYDDLRGDLQIQSNYSDGANSIEEMAEAAINQGLEYIVITDHTKSLGIANGLNEQAILEQIEYIKKLNLKFIGVKNGVQFRILTGAEVNILKNGELDIDDKILAKLDCVGASIHSHFNLNKEEQTERMKRAMLNENVDIIFHPTGRIINKRPPYEIDIIEIIKWAKKTNTVLEINAFPNRLDLKDDHIRLAVKEGVKFSINSDAHNIYHLKYLEYGIAQARRGWVEKKDVINSKSLTEFLKFIKKPKNERF